MHPVMKNEGFVSDLLKNSPSFKYIMNSPTISDKENSFSNNASNKTRKTIQCNRAVLRTVLFKRKSEDSRKLNKRLCGTPVVNDKTSQSHLDDVVVKMKKLSLEGSSSKMPR